MFTKSIFLSILTLALTPLMFFIAQKIMKRSSKYFIEQQRNLGRVNGYIEEIMTGQKVVKVFCHEENVKKEFEKLNDELRVSATKAQA
jgi:ATP-binding cassette subfamily B protein